MSDDTVGKFWNLSLHDDEADFLRPYDLSSKPTGYCLVYNNIKFERCFDRTGCDKDFKRIESTFKPLGFVVEEKKDKTCEEMENELKEIAANYDKKHSCIVIFFCSHGVSGDKLFDVKGNCVKIHQLVRLFNAVNCPQLAGKPKLFFVEMCRGGKALGTDTSKSSTIFTGGRGTKKYVPTDQDILVVFSTGTGFDSMYDFDNGAWFIQALTEAMQRWGDIENFLTILQRTTAMILERAKRPKENTEMCPTYESSLSRELRFRRVQST